MPTRNAGALARLTLAQTAGQAGTWAGYVAALPAALAQPHPAIALSAVTAAWGIPSIAARLAGGMVDHHGPRRIGTAAWTLATLAAACAAASHPTLPTLLAILVVLSLGGTWGVTAGEAAPTWLPHRPDLARAGSWLVIASSLPLAIGPLAATNLITYTGDRAAWTLVAVLSATAALTTLRIPAEQPDTTTATSQARAPRIPRPVRVILVVTASIYLTFGAITILEPLYVREVLHAPFTDYGWLLATVGIAGIPTSLAATRWPAIIISPWAVPIATLTVAAGEIIYINTPVLDAAFIGAATFSAGSALFRLSARAVIVAAVPPHQHGRALSLWETIQCTLFVAPAPITPTLVTILGLRAVLATCSTIASATATLTCATHDTTRRNTSSAHPRPTQHAGTRP
jgi:predicted MFS family arabinose efflux permease